MMNATMSICKLLLCYLYVVSGLINNIKSKILRTSSSVVFMSSVPQNSNSNTPVIGNEGEHYFIPGKPAKVNGPLKTIGKTKLVPIFPYNDIILPGSTEPITVFDMRNRQLLQEVEANDGLFAIGFYSQQLQRISLVATLARIKERRINEDGRLSCIVEGVGRCYLEQVVSEKPYIKGVVRPFYDYTVSSDVLDSLERQIYEEIIANLKLMEMLNPGRSFSPSQALIENRPLMPAKGIRAIYFGDDLHDMKRRTKFSYAVMEMLRLTPQLKLSLLQDSLIERRYAKCLKVISSGSNYLREELRNKGLIVEDEGFLKLKSQIINEDLHADKFTQTNLVPENYVDGKWVQMATIM